MDLNFSTPITILSRRSRHFALFGMLVFLASGMPVFASAIYGTPADFTGTRSVSAGELVGTGRFSDFTVSWTILPTGGGNLLYTYTFDWGSVSKKQSISHIILDLSDVCVVGSSLAPGCLTDPSEGELEPGTYGPHPSNPGFPTGAAITGVKFDDLETEPFTTLSFISNRLPMWGNIYMKAGSHDYLFNKGLKPAFAGSDSASLFVAVPDTAIPEPGSAWLILAGGILLLVGRRRKEKEEAS